MAYLNSSNERSYYSSLDNINNTGDELYGGYQFVSLNSIVDYFMAVYVGEDKIIKRIKKYEALFHAKRNLAELSFDTFKSIKSQEITLPPSLTMPLPIDYVNYTKICYTDDSGIQHIIYPTSKTSNPKAILQDADGAYQIKETVTYTSGSTTATIASVNTNIKIGMTIDSVFATGTVSDISHTDTTTTITLSTAATQTGDQTTVFFNDQLSVENSGSSFVLTGLTIAASTNQVTLTSTDSVVRGMFIRNENFGSNTRVTSVDGNVITLNASSTNTSSANDQAITFIKEEKDSSTWTSYKSHNPAENNINDYQDYENNIYWPNEGERYGLDPQHAQSNGSFYIDELKGKIHFSSNLSGQNIVLKYISDSLGTDSEMQVHKFAEDAMYKAIICDVLSTKANIPEYVIRRYKKEKIATRRKAKLRLSNIKLEEITQILRGKSKQIKH